MAMTVCSLSAIGVVMAIDSLFPIFVGRDGDGPWLSVRCLGSGWRQPLAVFPLAFLLLVGVMVVMAVCSLSRVRVAMAMAVCSLSRVGVTMAICLGSGWR